MLSIAIAVAACGDGGHSAVDAPSGADAATDAAVDARPCTHGQATTPPIIHGRSFATIQRVSAQVVFAGDPWPAILLEAGPVERCDCDAPPAGGAGNTLITLMTNWPLEANVRAPIVGLYMHAD